MGKSGNNDSEGNQTNLLLYGSGKSGGWADSFLKNIASNLPPIGEKLLVVVLGLVLFCIFISDLDGNMESILVILINVTKPEKVVW